MLNSLEEISVEDHFRQTHMRQLYHEKIARSRATGKDGIRVNVFEETLTENLTVIERKIEAETYTFTTFKERLLLKGPNKSPRQICIPTVRDRLVLRVICQILHQKIPQSIGYSPHALIDRVANQLRANEEKRAFVRIDVRDFFPSIRHDLLKNELKRFGIDDVTLKLCMKAMSTKAGSEEEARSIGIPQGLSVSGALACIYMLRFDDRQASRFASYFRYVDDILMIINIDEAPTALRSIKRALAHLGLKAHLLGTKSKTEIKDTDEGIDYLGYHITRDLISVRSTSFKRMFNNILKVITDYRYRKDVERLIFRLNLKISGCIVDRKRRGWMMFFSRTENHRQLSHLDYFVRQQLKRVQLPIIDRSRVKQFIKSYHEICFNLDRTIYVPNFDNFDLEQKTHVVAILLRRPIDEIKSFAVEEIERQFSRLVGQEINDLENDIGNPS